MILLEVGNSTIKSSRVLDGVPSDVERFASVDELLASLAGSTEPLVVAPVGERLSRDLLGRLDGSRQLRVLDREHFGNFVAGSYDTPGTLGLDRILNLRALDGDGVAISCGTAITVDAVVGGRPVWGAILPGFTTAAVGLHERIPVLPLVGTANAPRLPARTSVDSVTNGVLLATALGALAVADRLVATANGKREGEMMMMDPIVTGGDAELFATLCRPRRCVVDAMLTIRGMYCAARDLA